MTAEREEQVEGRKKRLAFIDLEDTVIAPVLQGWQAAEPIARFRQVAEVLRQWEPDEVRVFSFAVRDQTDVEGFRHHVMPWLKTALGFEISAIPTTDEEILPTVAKALGLHPARLDFSDVVDFLGKGGAFKLFAREMATKDAHGMDVLLIDDAVEDELFEFPRLRLSGQLVNVERL